MKQNSIILRFFSSLSCLAIARFSLGMFRRTPNWSFHPAESPHP